MKNVYQILAIGIISLNFASGNMTNAKEQWLNFKKNQHKSFRNIAEEWRRFSIFENNLKQINEHNELYEKGETSYMMGLNPYSDMDFEEFNQLKMGISMESRENSPYYETYTLNSSYANTPNTWDWRHYGAVTSVKNQKSCGSCWAFSSTGALEGQYFLIKKTLPVLSEQNLVDCVYNRDGCSGGWMNQAFNYIKNNNGINSEKTYPYKAKNGECSFQKNKIAATCNGYIYIDNNEDALKQAVAVKGPIAVAIDAGNKFRHYKKGVYDEPACSQIVTHAVLIVGYGSEKGKDYWLVKNSWGTKWGEKGYIKMSRNKHNQCAIASHAIVPVV